MTLQEKAQAQANAGIGASQEALVRAYISGYMECFVDATANFNRICNIKPSDQ